MASTPGSSAAPAGVDSRERTYIRLSAKDRMHVSYWADKRGISMNEYMAEAVAAAVRRENQDYDLPTLEIARLNQLIDQVASLAKNVANMEQSQTQTMDALLGLARGGSENYLEHTGDGTL